MPRDHRWYGCRRDTRDARDTPFRFHALRIPESVDLRDKSAPVQDQGELGSCTAHGITGAMRDMLIRKGHSDFLPSRLALYWQERFEEGTVNDDSGAEIRTGIKCVNKYGLGLETTWPYDISRFKDEPPGSVFDEGAFHRALTYQRVPVSASAVKQALAQHLSVIVGLTLYDSFESDKVAKTGIVPMPDLHREEIVGGHCMRVLGYDKGYFIVRNNWNTDWGDKGDCYIPEKMLGSPNYGSDYWVVLTEDP